METTSQPPNIPETVIEAATDEAAAYQQEHPQQELLAALRPEEDQQ